MHTRSSSVRVSGWIASHPALWISSKSTLALATGECGVHPVNHLSNILTHHLISDEDNYRDRSEYQCILSHRLSAPQCPNLQAHSFDRNHTTVLPFRLWTTFDVAQSVMSFNFYSWLRRLSDQRRFRRLRPMTIYCRYCR